MFFILNELQIPGMPKVTQLNALAGITLSTNKYAPAPKFYQKNGFEIAEHVMFMCKEIEKEMVAPAK